MKAINEDAIQAGFITVMNKLTYGRDAVLKPLLNALKSSDRTEGFGRISELERKLEENAKHRERLRTMLTQGLLDAEIFNDENNLLLSEYERMETELSDLRAGINSTLTQISEIDELIRHLGSGEMQTEYDEEQFLLFVDHIIIHSASDIEFVLKCGLRLREKV